jgi:hypothetical protein
MKPSGTSLAIGVSTTGRRGWRATGSRKNVFFSPESASYSSRAGKVEVFIFRIRGEFLLVCVDEGLPESRQRFFHSWRFASFHAVERLATSLARFGQLWHVFVSMDLAASSLEVPAPQRAPVPRSGGPLLRALRILLPFALVASIIALRFPTPLLRAEFWAEDATEFFFDAVSLGPWSLVTPVYGYHFVLEHLIAYGATFLPVFYTPYVYAWACLLVDAAALAYLAKDGFSWIAPRWWQRVLLAVLLALAPGTPDVLLNLANLPNPLALLGFLLLVERPFRMGGLKLLGFALIAASSGHVLLWLPIAAYLAWINRSRGYAAATAVITIFTFLNGAGTQAASKSAGSFDLHAVAEVPRILLENGFARLLPRVAGLKQRPRSPNRS